MRGVPATVGALALAACIDLGAPASLTGSAKTPVDAAEIDARTPAPVDAPVVAPVDAAVTPPAPDAAPSPIDKPPPPVDAASDPAAVIRDVNTARASLLVTGTPATPIGAVIVSRLEKLGFAVMVKADADAVTADANGQALVVIAPDTNSANVREKFRDVAVPVVVLDTPVFASMMMTAAGGWGRTRSQTQIQIVAPSHPLAAGLTGTVTVFGAPSDLGWGAPSAAATGVATPVAEPGHMSIFGYAAGAMMVNKVAPARRVGAAGGVINGAATPAWEALLDAAVQWAVGSN